MHCRMINDVATTRAIQTDTQPTLHPRNTKYNPTTQESKTKKRYVSSNLKQLPKKD
jgi:hypothetical protein